MSLIDSSAVFFTPMEIFLRHLLQMSMIPLSVQDLSVYFTDVEVNEHGQITLNSFSLVKEILQTCKGGRGRYSNEHPINQ